MQPTRGTTALHPEGTRAAERPPLEPVPGPVTREQVERRWLGVPARLVLLCLCCSTLGATVGLFASSSWAWAAVMLLLTLVLAAVLTVAARHAGGRWPEQSGRLAADGRAQAASAAEVWRTRLETAFTRWRTRSRIDELELARPAALQALGDAVHRGDKEAQHGARRRLAELDARRRALEEELEAHLRGAEERIRLARLPVQETLLVAPNAPAAPYPPPGGGTPPGPSPNPGREEPS